MFVVLADEMGEAFLSSGTIGKVLIVFEAQGFHMYIFFTL